jgi:hypothetical protein
MAESAELRERGIALVLLLVGIGMLTIAFTTMVPNQQYVQLLAEKVLLEKQGKPHDHLNPDAVEKFRPAWKNPIFIFGIGAMVLAGVQFALSNSDRRRVTSDSRKS